MGNFFPILTGKNQPSRRLKGREDKQGPEAGCTATPAALEGKLAEGASAGRSGRVHTEQIGVQLAGFFQPNQSYILVWKPV